MIRSATQVPARRRRPLLAAAALVGAALAAGCASPPPSIVSGPVSVRPVAPPTFVERNATGGIYRANFNTVSLFSDQRKPQAIGDTIKIDINENLSAVSKVNNTTSRANSVSSVGPGMNSNSLGGLLKGLANMNATATGSDAFTGKGDSENTNTLTGRIAAYVVNVLSNGNLVVAGERSIVYNKGLTTLRFSGVVNPLDIKSGGIVASNDVVDAKMEVVGDGGASDAQGRGWLQKLLTDTLSVW